MTAGRAVVRHPNAPADEAAPRTLPHNFPAEQAVLGAVLLRNELIRDPDFRIATDDFYDPRHQAVWSAMSELAEERQPIDVVTIEAHLKLAGKLQVGFAYLGQLELRVPTADNARAYADVVRELADRRRLMRAASQVADRGYNADVTAEQLRAALASAAEPTHSNRQGWLDRRGIVELIRSRAREPWMPIMLGTSVIVEVRAESLVTLAGPTGSGKTSLAAALAAAIAGDSASHHARAAGWALVLSRELTVDELAARMIGATTDRSCRQALECDGLSDDEMVEALPERLRIVDRERATFDALDAEVARIRAEEPDTPIMAVVDYGQLLAVRSEHMRFSVGDVWATADAIARRHRAVVVMLSQMGRAASRAARGGERLGGDALDGGADSADIERYSTVVLEIGQAGPEDQYGRREVAVSLAKGRMGGGDRVVPMAHEGRTGRWAVIGEAKPAAEVKAAAAAQNGDRKAQASALAIRQVAEQSAEPKTRDELIAAAMVGKASGRPAIQMLLAAGDLVEVHRKQPRSSAWKLWTRVKAAAAGIPLLDAQAEVKP